jgi:hypothetical protein
MVQLIAGMERGHSVEFQLHPHHARRSAKNS